MAALEILVVDMAIANLVREGKTHQIPGMIQVGKKKGNQPLDDAIMSICKTPASRRKKPTTSASIRKNSVPS